MATTTPNFALDILHCPPSGSIKSIVYSNPTKLCVIEESQTLMCIDLKDFFIPVADAQRTSFTLPGYSSLEIPLTQNLVDFCGLGSTAGAKFASFFLSYPSGTASSAQQYVQWDFESEVTTGPLASLDPVVIDNSGSVDGATGSDPYYRINVSSDIVTIDGTKFGLVSTDAQAVATKGGLKLWSEIDGTSLFNTFNSEIASNELTSLSYSPEGIIWVGSGDAGVIKVDWNDSVFSFSSYNTSNSGIISNVINDVFFSDDLLAIATDSGISLLDTIGGTWSNFSRVNVNQIDDLEFNSVCIDYPYMIAGASSGVYVYDITSAVWNKYDNSIVGWTASNYVNTVISYDQTVFAGLTGGVVSFSIGATSCQELNLPLGTTSSYRDTSVIWYEPGVVGATLPADSDKLLVGSYLGEIYEYNFIGDTWITYSGNLGDLMQDGINSMNVDGYVYLCNDTGFARLDTDSDTVETLPLASQTSDILFSYPLDGSFPVSLSQAIYVGFSKPVDSAVLEEHIVFSNLTTGATVAYSLTSSDNYYYQIVPGSTLSYANLYQFQIVSGLTSADGKYFRQTVDSSFISLDKNPASGWHVAGKQLTLSGADGNYVQPIVFRNPHSFDVSVTALIAV